MESLSISFSPTVVQTLEFGNMYVQYVFENGKFWLNATDLIKGILKISLPTIQRLKENEFRTLEDSRAEKVFVEWTVLEKLFRTKLNDGKQEKTETFEDFICDGGFEKMMVIIHQKENVEFLTIDLLKGKLDAANERANRFENLLLDSDDSNKQKDATLAAYLKDCINLKELKDAAIVEHDELQQQFTQQSEILNGCIMTITEHVETIETKNCEIEGFMNEHNSTIEKLNADHEAEKVAIIEENNDKATKISENHTKEIEQLNADHKKVLQPLLERSKLRRWLADCDKPLFILGFLQIGCMAVMFPLIASHYEFKGLPDIVAVLLQMLITSMLPITSIFFAIRKKKWWVMGVFAFEVLFSNSQTKLLNEIFIGNEHLIHIIEKTATTFFLPLLVTAFTILALERESNKVLLITPKE